VSGNVTFTVLNVIYRIITSIKPMLISRDFISSNTRLVRHTTASLFLRSHQL